MQLMFGMHTLSTFQATQSFFQHELPMKKIIKIIVDDNYDAIYDFNSSFDENLLYTVIVPITLIDNIDVLITSFLLSE